MMRGNAQKSVPCTQDWLKAVTYINPAALGSFPEDASPGVAFHGKEFETVAVWRDDSLVAVKVTVGEFENTGTVTAYIAERSLRPAQLLATPALCQQWRLLSWASASIWDANVGLSKGWRPRALGGASAAAFIAAVLPVSARGIKNNMQRFLLNVLGVAVKHMGQGQFETQTKFNVAGEHGTELLINQIQRKGVAAFRLRLNEVIDNAIRTLQVHFFTARTVPMTLFELAIWERWMPLFTAAAATCANRPHTWPTATTHHTHDPLL